MGNAHHRQRKRDASRGVVDVPAPADLLLKKKKAVMPTVAVCGDYSHIHVYRMDTAEKVVSAVVEGCWSHNALTACRLGNGPLLAGASNSEVHFLSLKSGRVLERPVLRHLSQVYAILNLPASSYGDDLFVTADRIVRVWKSAEGRQVVSFRGHTATILSLCDVPSKKWIASASYDNTIRVWDLKTQKDVPDGIIEAPRSPHVMMFGGTEHPSIFSGSLHDAKIKMLSLDGFRCMKTFNTPGASCYSLLLHPTRTHLLFSGHALQLYLWDIRKEDRFVKQHVAPHGSAHSTAVTGIVSAGPGLIASCGTEGGIHCWTETLEPRGVQWQTGGPNRCLVCVEPFPEGSRPSPSDLLPEDFGVAEDCSPEKEMEERVEYLLQEGLTGPFRGSWSRVLGIGANVIVYPIFMRE